MDHLFISVEGKDFGDIKVYALSTCIWCKKAKSYLDDKGIKYRYVFVDQLDENDRTNMREEVKKWNPSCSFPTIVFRNDVCVVGFNTESIEKELIDGK